MFPSLELFFFLVTPSFAIFIFELEIGFNFPLARASASTPYSSAVVLIASCKLAAIFFFYAMSFNLVFAPNTFDFNALNFNLSNGSEGFNSSS